MKKPLPVLHERIDLGNKTIEYTWARKPVKNINLRVRSDGSVSVSSPVKMSEKTIREFLFDRADFIFSALDRFEKRRAQLPPQIRFQAGDSFPLFGKAVLLNVKKGKPTGGWLEGETLTLTLPEPESEAQRKRAAEKWAKSALEERILQFCAKAKTDFLPFRIPTPTVKFRKMRSRWGSCNTKNAMLTFNLSLVAAPEEAVEYVVYHEFAHLVHANHSAKFYALVEQFLPDWKARKALLRNVPCSLFGT